MIQIEDTQKLAAIRKKYDQLKNYVLLGALKLLKYLILSINKILINLYKIRWGVYCD